MRDAPDYTPALRFHLLTTFYDSVMDRLMHDTEIKRRLIRQIGAKAGQKIVDVGCGTGTLSILLKKDFPCAEVFGVDIDPNVLRIAERKRSEANVELVLRRSAAQSLPFETGSMDQAISSLVLHHLPLTAKRETLREIARVLRPGGRFHLLDWGKGDNVYERVAFALVRLLDGFETTRENAQGQVASLLMEAGFADVTPTFSEAVPLGRLQCFEAVRN